MGKVQAIAEQIQELSGEEFAELREWFWEQDSKDREEQVTSQVTSEAVAEPLEEIVLDALAQYDSAQARKS